MFAKSSITTLLASAALAGAANPDHPVVNPKLNWDSMETPFRNALNPTHSVWDYWGAGWITEGCKVNAVNHNLNPADFTLFNVHYDDCSEPWIFCRHKNAPATEIQMIDMFGRLPVHMRSYAREFIATPNLNDGNAAFTNNFGDVLFEGSPDLHTLIHELSHSLDWHAISSANVSQFSSGKEWQSNYALDTLSVSDYSRTNWAENFAEVGIVGVYDKVVPGGIGGVTSQWSGFFHQYATYQGYLGDNILPGGTCRNRLPNPEVQSMSTTRKGRRGAKPDVSFKNSTIKVIEIDPNQELEIAYLPRK